MNGITFKVDDTLKMRDLRQAENSNSAAINVMAKYAVDETTHAPMPYEAFSALVDEMGMAEFYQLYAEFVGSAVPNANGRR